MTLLSKATRLFFAACLIALIVSGIGGYVFLQKIMDEEATEQLAHEHQQVINFVEQTGVLPERWFSISDSLWAIPMQTVVPIQLFDTTLTNRAENESLMYRQLSFGIDTQLGYYQVNIRKALYKVHDLTKALLLAFSVLILLLVGILFWVNYSLSRNLWQPFYQTLAKLKTFKISEDEALHFAPTEIVEFKTLQTTLEQLTQKVRQDYISLKTFTENASHELQTPLAVIGANLEQLLQAANLTQTQVEQIDSLLDVVRRISKMNQALLLLTKIENRQYEAHESIDFSELVEDKLNLWEALIQHKGIKLTTHITPHVHIPINPFLADVLLNNLLK
jgi:signal transduction histidine kinase